ncbi:hypothetical protein TRAPUB_4915 [Trametes pubescens]|uniref:Uncharacterized protein n=1 Tax=Trametes pubescens TaxID=154538 RepID=A0A1M2V9Z9_TRAPU|nr:hypothetical protein TRAPUB_4915 [Trametes pubescens]
MVPFMTMPALQALANVSPACKNLVVTHLDLAYDEALRQYVQDPHGLRGVMRMLRAVISGSFGLAFLLRNAGLAITPGDLDLYVPMEFATRLAAYLVSVEGYTHSATSPVPYGRNTAHQLVIVLEKEGRRIDVVPSVNDSAIYPISHFWSTHVMNYITADTFCLAYPELTFSGRALLSPFQLIRGRHTSAYIVALIRKYEDRGFAFRVRSYAWGNGTSPLACANTEGCSRVRRFFGDRYCMVGSLSRTYEDCGFERGLPGPTTVCWWRGGDICGTECDNRGMLGERAVPAAAIIDTKFLPETL